MTGAYATQLKILMQSADVNVSNDVVSISTTQDVKDVCNYSHSLSARLTAGFLQKL